MGDHGGRATPPRPPRRRWRPWLAVLVGALALALGVAACSGAGKPGGVASLSGSDKTTTTNANRGGDKLAAELNWARCMRQHGINISDPTPDGGIDEQLPTGMRKDDPKFKAAEQACNQVLPDGGGQGDPPTGQQRQRALAFARCMRQHGINMPDPQITADGIGQQWPERAERETPKFRAAQQACEQAVPPARR
jgi:hypothetical protein